MNAEFYVDGQEWENASYLTDDLAAALESSDVQVNYYYDYDDNVLVVTQETNETAKNIEQIIKDDAAFNAKEHEEIIIISEQNQDLIKEVSDKIDAQDDKEQLIYILDKVTSIESILREKNESEKSDSEGIDDRIEVDGEKNISALDSSIFQKTKEQTRGEQEQEVVEITLNDIHNDLVMMNDNIIYLGLFLFASVISLIGLVLGKELWKSW